MNLERGVLLISEPFLNDGHFDRSVILVCDHKESGSFGLVLNKPTEHVLEDVLSELAVFPATAGLPLYLGGPVEQNTLHYIHTLGPALEGSEYIGEGFYLGGSFEQLKELLRSEPIEPGQIRFFLGYSGWQAGQLDKEYEEKTWITGKNIPEDLLEIEPAALWRSLLLRLGGKYKELANYPIDPRLN
ncbi:MAG: YqgE/AlgH family protein [Bacteroidota bacterium]